MPKIGVNLPVHVNFRFKSLKLRSSRPLDGRPHNVGSRPTCIYHLNRLQIVAVGMQCADLNTCEPSRLQFD